MKLKYKLEQIIHNTQEKTESWTFIFKPTLDEYQKRCTFKVSTGDPYETMGKLGLPQSVGDIIVLETSTKNEQKSLKTTSTKKED